MATRALARMAWMASDRPNGSLPPSEKRPAITATGTALATTKTAASTNRRRAASTMAASHSRRAATGLAAPASRARTPARDPTSLLDGQQGAQAAGHPHAERHPAFDEVGRLAHCRGNAAEEWSPSTGVLEQAGQQERGRHRRHRADDLGPNHRHHRRHPERVAERVGAAEPSEVDRRQRMVAGEVGAGQLGGEVDAHPRGEQVGGDEDDRDGRRLHGRVGGEPSHAGRVRAARRAAAQDIQSTHKRESVIHRGVPCPQRGPERTRARRVKPSVELWARRSVRPPRGERATGGPSRARRARPG